MRSSPTWSGRTPPNRTDHPDSLALGAADRPGSNQPARDNGLVGKRSLGLVPGPQGATVDRGSRGDQQVGGLLDPAALSCHGEQPTVRDCSFFVDRNRSEGFPDSVQPDLPGAANMSCPCQFHSGLKFANCHYRDCRVVRKFESFISTGDQDRCVQQRSGQVTGASAASSSASRSSVSIGVERMSATVAASTSVLRPPTGGPRLATGRPRTVIV